LALLSFTNTRYTLKARFVPYQHSDTFEIAQSALDVLLDGSVVLGIAISGIKSSNATEKSFSAGSWKTWLACMITEVDGSLPDRHKLTDWGVTPTTLAS
jgi:hypothetical protein